MYSDNGLIPRIDTLGAEFDRALQGRMDWIDQIMPHAPGEVKLNEQEQLVQFDQQMQNPEAMKALVQQHGTVEVERYIRTMTKMRERNAR